MLSTMQRLRALGPIILAAGAGAALSAGLPAFPSHAHGLVTGGTSRAVRRPSRYPWSSAKQDARRYETVMGRNGHATMRRVK